MEPRPDPVSWKPVEPENNRISGMVVDAALRVHRRLGPGLLESIYEECLCLELRERGIGVRRQVQVPITYRERLLDTRLRLDLLVEERVVVELKSVEVLTALHRAQILTYLRLSGVRLGLLINFNTVLLKDGIVRIVL